LYQTLENNMIKTTIVAALMAVGLMAVPVQANGVKLGTLTCQIEGGPGLLIGSVRQGECTYRDNQGHTKSYDATFSRLGIDVGVSGNKTIVWSVFGADGVSNGGLKGTYTGITAEASLVIGVGANALIGGFKSGIVLNPVSISGHTGINVAAGAATLRLE
jgi:hypothetical protein